MDYYVQCATSKIPTAFASDPLDFIGLGVLNKNRLVTTVYEPTRQKQVIERGTLRLRSGGRNRRKRIVFPYPSVTIELETGRNLLRKRTGNNRPEEDGEAGSTPYHHPFDRCSQAMRAAEWERNH
jgi:hypothetical protein